MKFDDVLIDLKPDRDDFGQEVRDGLATNQRTVPCKFIYDERGSELFEKICEQPEYYPTRTELKIMEESIDSMVEAIGPRARVIECGPGSGIKTKMLLDHLEDPAAYIPIEISKSALRGCFQELTREFPELEIVPVCADYTDHIDIPETEGDYERNVVYFPGSTLGNFPKDVARSFMRRSAEFAGEDGAMLLGVDLAKDPDILRKAYNDEAGVTAAFNMNLLHRMNRELGGNFDTDAFHHEAIYNPEHTRIEMHLVSEREQTVDVAGETYEFDEGQTICTEYSHKYTPEAFEELATGAGFDVRQMWTDGDNLFSIWYLETM